MGLNSSYASTIPAVFKLVESVLNLVTIILVSVNQSNYLKSQSGAAGWMLFVSLLTLIVSLFFYIIHLTNVIFRLAGPMTFIEFLCILICGVFQLTCMIVAAATTGQRGTIIAAAVMYALNFVTYAVDSFFLFALYKVHGGYLNNPAVIQPPAAAPPVMQQQPAYYPSDYNDPTEQGIYPPNPYASQ